MIKNNEITAEIIGIYFLTKDNLTQKRHLNKYSMHIHGTLL